MADFIASERESEYWGRNPYDREQFMAASALDFAIPSTWANYEETAAQGRRAMDLEERIAATLDPQEKKVLRSELAALKKEVKPLLKEAEAWREDVIVIDEARINTILEKAKSLGLRAETYNQSVYHGTPHRFDRFDLSKIGSGEGAQAYGWGLYFAGDRDISEWYRRKLSKSQQKVTLDGQELTQYDNNPARGYLYTLLDSNSFDTDKTISDLEERIRAIEEWNARPGVATYAREMNQQHAVVAQQALDFLRNGVLDVQRSKGQLFKVDIPESDVLLDYASPLSEQPETVRTAIERAARELGLTMTDQELKTLLEDIMDQHEGHFADVTEMEEALPLIDDLIEQTHDEIGKYVRTGEFGQDLYEQVMHLLQEMRTEYKVGSTTLQNFLRDYTHMADFIATGGSDISGYNVYLAISNVLGSDKAASEYLNSLGIPGLRYLDANSRGGGKESYQLS